MEFSQEKNGWENENKIASNQNDGDFILQRSNQVLQKAKKRELSKDRDVQWSVSISDWSSSFSAKDAKSDLNFRAITLKALNEWFDSLDNSRAPVPRTFIACAVKAVKILSYLQFMFNDCILEHFQYCSKFVFSVLFTVDARVSENYRPVSVTPCLHNFLEVLYWTK